MIKDNICPVCNQHFEKLSKHVSSSHAEFAIQQKDDIVKLFLSGISCEEIAKLPHIIYAGKSGVVKIVSKYVSKEEIEKHRRANISSTLIESYSSGQLDWIKNINAERSKNPTERAKNSEGVKRAYADGRKTAWMKGKTKKTDVRISKSADKVSVTMTAKYASGRLTTAFKSGDQHMSWKVDRATVSNYWRKNFDFQRKDKEKLLVKSNYRCAHCKIHQLALADERITTNSSRLILEFDHINPISNGGLRDIETNGQVLCSRCHIIKTLSERHDCNEVKRASILNRFNLHPAAYLYKKFGGSIDSEQLLWKSSESELPLSTLVHPLTQEFCGEKFLLRTLKAEHDDRCIIFFADEWNAKREIALSMINNRLKLGSNKIGARDCTLLEISAQESSDFMNTNHIAGATVAVYHFALKCDEKIVAVLTFRRPFTKRDEHTIEIARFASLLNTNIPGGFNRLLKFAIKRLKSDGYTSILTYADLRFGSGNVYKNAGFDLIGKTDLDYFYTNGFERFGRMKFRAKGGISEKDIAKNAGVYRVYGCGSNIYQMKL